MSGESHYGAHPAAVPNQYSIQVPHTNGVTHHSSVTPPLPGQHPYGYREDGSSYSHYGMNGIAGGPHPYHSSVPSALRGPPPQNGGPSPWASPYNYPAPVSQDAPQPITASYTASDHSGSWTKNPSFVRSQQPQDQNFPHSHSFNFHQHSRPHHSPMEPGAAPSPPNRSMFPNSPRTPISPHPVLNNGIPTPQPFRQPNRVSVAPSVDNTSHRPEPPSGYPKSVQPSVSTHSLLPRQQGRGSVVSPLGPPGSVGVNGVHRGSISYGSPHRSSGGYGPLPQSAVEDERKGVERPVSTPQTIRTHGSQSEYDSADDEKRIKQERGSRTPSVSMSPKTTRIGPTSERSPSFSSSVSKANGMDVPGKKKGAPVFKDHNGNEYYENEPVPPGVEPPSGWQIGTGKHTKGLLLPRMKDGIQVNPEWGFTAGGKARQRLPQACRNCRAKKIRCMESDFDESICQHCMKMRIQCQRYEKDDDKKKKRASQTQEFIKSENGERSGSIVSEFGLADIKTNVPVKNGSRKRKSADGSSNGAKKVNRGTGSRAGSITGEYVQLPLSNERRVTYYDAQLLVDERPPLFPKSTIEARAQTSAQDSESRERHLRELRENYGSRQQDIHRHRNNSLPDTSPLSFPSASPSNGGSPLDMPNIGFMEGGIPGYAPPADFRHRDDITTPVTIETPPPHSVMIHTIGEDPRHPSLPGPDILHHLVDAYFANIYSQTYAFLHRKTFTENLHKHPPVLLLSMCAVAARFSKVKDREPIFEQGTRDLIMKDYDKYNLEMVQSMVHMGLHDFGSNNGSKAWMFAGMAVRMGAALNMNLEIRKKDTTKDAITRECTRRTYWSYYLMDRFNSYGVARPFLTQDHDCHIQLPCNQPSFDEGKYVATEHLLGPNPYNPEVGTKYMGAMAYLVRLVGIWGNILKQIHLSAFQTYSPDKKSKGKAGNEFNHLIEKLEDWRKTLPTGLEYSNENLAGQIKVGTTGAFVTMHVMWHTAMAYVHRYVRTVGKPKLYIQDNIPTATIVESIRKAFVHADAVLQIMFHVRQQRDLARANNQPPVTVNAPFLGQAISDACNITVIRALEVRSEPGGAEEQKRRVWMGLDWLKELRRHWGPIEGMYQKLKRSCKKLESNTSQPPSARLAPTPESSVDSGLQPGSQYPVDPTDYTAEPTFTSHAIPVDPVGGDFARFTDYLSSGNLSVTFFNEAFAADMSRFALCEYARNEGGFPDLYTTTRYSGAHLASVSAPYSYEIPQNPTLGGEMLEPMMLDHQMPMTARASIDTGHQSDLSGNEDDDMELGEDGELVEKSNINTVYFDPTAVLDGVLQDSASDSSGHSRRASNAATTRPDNNNPMDLLHLINPTTSVYRDEITQSLNRHDGGDKFTGPNGAAAPANNDLGGQPNLDNSGAAHS